MSGEMKQMSKCELCGEPMPAGEEMFKYHGYSGDCPKPPMPRYDFDVTGQPAQAGKKCTGQNCTAIDGVSHSAECIAEHERTVDAGRLDTPGNRHPGHRYAGYVGRPQDPRATTDQAKAWEEGRRASVPAPAAQQAAVEPVGEVQVIARVPSDVPGFMSDVLGGVLDQGKVKAGDKLYANPKPAAPDVDDLAQFIRQIDGKREMGAGALAERICDWLADRMQEPT